MVSDPDGASIAWTAYGKVRDVTVGSNVTKFRYDAAGHSRAGNRAIKSTAVQATYINGVLSARTLYGKQPAGQACR